MRRRLALRLAALLLAALALNLLVAQAFALRGRLGPGASVALRNGQTERSSPEAPDLDWPVPVPTDWPDTPTQIDAARGPGASLAIASGGSPTPAGGWDGYVVIDARSGWPFRTLRWTDYAGRAPERPLEAGIHLAERLTFDVVTSRPGPVNGSPITNRRTIAIPRRIPFYPVWPGLIANTLLYAAALGALLLAINATRAALRRRKGLCPACGYDLAGLTTAACPECGASPRP